MSVGGVLGVLLATGCYGMGIGVTCAMWFSLYGAGDDEVLGVLASIFWPVGLPATAAFCIVRRHLEQRERDARMLRDIEAELDL